MSSTTGRVSAPTDQYRMVRLPVCRYDMTGISTAPSKDAHICLSDEDKRQTLKCGNLREQEVARIAMAARNKINRKIRGSK